MRRNLFSHLGPVLAALLWLSVGIAQADETGHSGGVVAPARVPGEAPEDPSPKPSEQSPPKDEGAPSEAPASPKSSGEYSDVPTQEGTDKGGSSEGMPADVTTRATVRVPLVGDSPDESPSPAKASKAEKSRSSSGAKKSPAKKSRAKKRRRRDSSKANKSKRRRNPGKKGKKSKKTKKPGHPDCEYRTPIYQHKVAEGEHVGSIAGRYGVRRADIIKLNPGLQKNPDLIHPGQTLRVCPDIAPRVRVEKQHVVTKGESLGKIASHYGLTVRELTGLQQGKLRTQLEQRPNSLWIGTKLRIFVEQEELEGFKPPSEDVGRLPVGVKFKPRSGVLIKRDHLVWGTKATIRALEKAIKTYYKRKPGGPRIRIGDISKKGGGPMRGHLSHQRGVDVDIGIVHRGSKRNAERFTHATTENFDVARTWTLLKAIIDTQAVRVVFLDYALQKRLYQYARKQGVSENTLDELLQYPRGRGRAFGIVRHWRSHRGHLHVRFRR